MKITNLNYGVCISNFNLANCSDNQLGHLIEICIENRLVIIKNQLMSLARFNEINEIMGIHQPTNIWASHPDYPKILRVTNKEVSTGVKGLFHNKQGLGWHSDGVFSPDPEDVTLLWCINPGINGATHFACGVHAYNSLDDSIKDEIEGCSIFLTNEMSKTYMKESIYGTLLPHEQMDLDKMSTRTRHFSGGAEGNPYNKNLSYIKTTRNDLPQSKKRRKDIKKPLIAKHPLSGIVGLYFPFCSVEKIAPLKNPSRMKEILSVLIENYVGSSGKIYTHHWQEGDLILSDQIHSLHRRDPHNEIRELYRTVFYYRDCYSQKEEQIVK